MRPFCELPLDGDYGPKLAVVDKFANDAELIRNLEQFVGWGASAAGREKLGSFDFEKFDGLVDRLLRRVESGRATMDPADKFLLDRKDRLRELKTCLADEGFYTDKKCLTPDGVALIFDARNYNVPKHSPVVDFFLGAAGSLETNAVETGKQLLDCVNLRMWDDDGRINTGNPALKNLAHNNIDQRIFNLAYFLAQTKAFLDDQASGGRIRIKNFQDRDDYWNRTVRSIKTGVLNNQGFMTDKANVLYMLTQVILERVNAIVTREDEAYARADAFVKQPKPAANATKLQGAGPGKISADRLSVFSRRAAEDPAKPTVGPGKLNPAAAAAFGGAAASAPGQPAGPASTPREGGYGADGGADAGENPGDVDEIPNLGETDDEEAQGDKERPAPEEPRKTGSGSANEIPNLGGEDYEEEEEEPGQ
jgi:hypothetical protein